MFSNSTVITVIHILVITSDVAEQETYQQLSGCNEQSVDSLPVFQSFIIQE